LGRPSRIDNATILAKARALFTEHGHSLSTKTIADQLGISQATLFKRFPTKAALFFAAMQPVNNLALFSFDQTNPQTFLTDFITVLLTQVEVFSPMIIKLMGHPDFMDFIQSLHTTNHHTQVRHYLITQLKQFQQQQQLNIDIDAETAAQYIIEALHGHVFIRLMGGIPIDCLSAEDRAKQLVTVLWQGLNPESRHLTL
jgi:AcrR family transcriptional regulator